MPKAKKAKGAVTSKSGKKPGKMRLGMIAFAMGLSLLFIMPTFILVLVGMAPTYVSLFTDTDRQKSSTAAIGAMNFAGVVPFIIDLWIKGQTIPTVVHILSDTTTWLVMLGAAGIGRLIVFAVPQVTATLTFIRAEARLKTLKKNLDSLRESWGPEVGTTRPLNQIQQGD